MFQSLLCWICCGKLTTGGYTRRVYCVSILIVLDLLWEGSNLYSKLSGQPGFNPYCAGFAVGSGFYDDWKRERSGVSILIVLDLLWEENRYRPLRCFQVGFQSLLCWICCGKPEVWYPCAGAGDVSILIVLDLLWEEGVYRVCFNDELLFQSLLCWICCGKFISWLIDLYIQLVSILIVLDLLWEDLVKEMKTQVITGFNPYCAGFAVGSPVHNSNKKAKTVFQSLLCWICCGKIFPILTISK